MGAQHRHKSSWHLQGIRWWTFRLQLSYSSQLLCLVPYKIQHEAKPCPKELSIHGHRAMHRNSKLGPQRALLKAAVGSWDAATGLRGCPCAAVQKTKLTRYLKKKPSVEWTHKELYFQPSELIERRVPEKRKHLCKRPKWNAYRKQLPYVK